MFKVVEKSVQRHIDDDSHDAKMQFTHIYMQGTEPCPDGFGKYNFGGKGALARKSLGSHEEQQPEIRSQELR